MQRTEFLNPEVEVIKFEAEDVITTSGETPGLDFDEDGVGSSEKPGDGSDFDDIWG